MFDKEFQSAPVNCKADRLSGFCSSRAKTSAIRTRHDKTTLLVTKGVNGHFRTLRAITYKKILNKSNVILAACLHLLATFGLECRAFACKKKNHLQKSGGGGGGGEGQAPPAPPRPPPMKVAAGSAVTSLTVSIAVTLMCTSVPQHCHYHCCHNAVLVFAATALRSFSLSQRCMCTYMSNHCGISLV